MKRLFLACDDVLVVYDETAAPWTPFKPHPFGILQGLTHKANTALVEYAEGYHRKGWEIIVWAPHSIDYAKGVGLEVMEDIPFTPHVQGDLLPGPGDICIDSEASSPLVLSWLKAGARVIGPYGPVTLKNARQPPGSRLAPWWRANGNVN